MTQRLLLVAIALPGLLQAQPVPYGLSVDRDAVQTNQRVKVMVNFGAASRWCGLRVDMGDGDVREIVVDEFPLTLTKRYMAAGRYVLRAEGRFVARGIGSAPGCVGAPRMLPVVVRDGETDAPGRRPDAVTRDERRNRDAEREQDQRGAETTRERNLRDAEPAGERGRREAEERREAPRRDRGATTVPAPAPAATPSRIPAPAPAATPPRTQAPAPAAIPPRPAAQGPAATPSRAPMPAPAATRPGTPAPAPAASSPRTPTPAASKPRDGTLKVF